MKKFLVVYEMEGEETEPKIETDRRIYEWNGSLTERSKSWHAIG